MIPIAEFGKLPFRQRIVDCRPLYSLAESDMIHKQQMGHSVPDILAGLCAAMVRNYLNNVGKGRNRPTVLFRGKHQWVCKALKMSWISIIVPRPLMYGSCGSSLASQKAHRRKRSRN